MLKCLNFSLLAFQFHGRALKLTAHHTHTHTQHEDTPYKVTCWSGRARERERERGRERLAKNDSNDFCYQVFFFVGLAFCIVFAGRAYFANFAVSFWAVKSMLHNLSTGTVDCDCHRIVFNALNLKLLVSTRLESGGSAEKYASLDLFFGFRLWPKNWHISASNRACEHWLMPTGITYLCSASVEEEATAARRNFRSAPPKLIEVFEWCQECRLIAGGEM